MRSHRQVPMIDWPADRRGYGWCKWCGESIPTVIDGKRSTQRLWHPLCGQEFELHSKVEVQRRFVVKRDGNRCAWPECGASPTRWHRGAIIHHWQPMPALGHLAPVGSDEWLALASAWRAENPTPMSQDIERVTALEVDHRVPLWSVQDIAMPDRRWYYGPGNLWLLCPLHHKAKTAAEAAQRAKRRIGAGQTQLELLPGPPPLA